MDIGTKARQLALSHEEIKKFIGGPPFSSEINKEIKNTKIFLPNNLPERQRVRLGFYQENDGNEISGYHSVTLLNNAAPTQYEKANLNLSGPLKYVQGKLLFIHPDYWGTEISKELLEKGLNLSQKLSLGWVADVKQNNKRAINFLKKFNIIPIQEWETPNKTKMYRLKCQ